MSALMLINGRDVSCFTIYDVTIDAGRQDIEEQPDGSVLTAQMVGYLDSGQVGDSIAVSDSLGVMFHGQITDLTATLEDLAWTTTVSAVGPLALLGQIEAGGTDYPPETDVDRVERVLEESGIGHSVLRTPDALRLMPRAAEVQPAAEIARAAATDGMGVLWENPADTDAPIRYTPHALRKWNMATPVPWHALPPTLTWATADMAWSEVDTSNLPGSAVPTIELDPCKVPAAVTFAQTMSDLVRTVTVVYGAEGVVMPVEGETEARPQITVGTEPPQQTYETQLSELADAETYAESMLRRHNEPAWRLSSIAVDLMTLTPDERANIRGALLLGARLIVPFPNGSPVGLLYQGFIEGWRHSLVSDGGWASHFVEIAASERRLTEAAERWKDASPATRWLDAAISWANALDVP